MKVPVYEQQVKQADSVQYGTGIETKATDMISPVSVVAEQAKVFSKIYQEQKDRTDKIRATEAIANLTKEETRISTFATSKKGKDAIGVYDSSFEDYEKQMQEIEKTLTNQEQKNYFRTEAQNRMLSLDRQLQGHVAIETVRYDNEVTKAAIENEEMAAIENYKDIGRVDLSIQNQIKTIREHADRNGVSDEEIENRIKEATTKTHSGVIQRMLSNDLELAAKEYFEGYSDQIHGEAKIKIEAAINDGSNRKQAQDAVDSYLKKGLSENAAYNAAREIEEPKLREETERRITLEYKRRESARRDGLEKAHISMLNMIDKGQDPTKSAIWSNLEGSQRNSILNYQENAAKGRSATTDPVVYSDLVSMASNPKTRESFKNIDLYTKLNSVGKKDFETLKKIQDDLRKDDSTSADLLKSNKDVMDSILDEVGIKDKKERALYENKMYELEKSVEKKTGKSLSVQEFKTLADSQMKEEISTGWFSSDKKVIDLEDEEIKNIKYKDVPKGEEKKIVDYLKRNGISAPTESQVSETYKKKLFKLRAKNE